MWPVARVSRTETDTSAERTIIILVAGSVAAAKLIIVLSIVSCPRSILLPLFFADFDVFFFFFFWRGSRVISPTDTDRGYMSSAVCRLLAVWMFAYRQECAIQI